MWQDKIISDLATSSQLSQKASKTGTMSNGDDMQPLCEHLGLFVKQCAKMYITIYLPSLKQPGQSISNWDLMERIKRAVLPVQLTTFRVVTSTVENVRFEAELQSRKLLLKVVKALDGYSMKVMGFFEPLKVRAVEAKSNFPTRHDWDEFFRTASDVNELKPGERPDTIYLAKLPSNWFKEDDTADDDSLPSEKQLKRVFERFGTVRCVDIPICDPYRKQMPSNLSGLRSNGFSFGQEVLFDAYVQFAEYTSFMKAMDFLRNMKLVKVMEDGKQFEALINVDFDRSKHLSDASIRKRQLERERISALERANNSEERLSRKSEGIAKNVIQTQSEERYEAVKKKPRDRSRERKRQNGKRKLSEIIATEERKLLIAQRKLESRRLLSVLIGRLENSDARQTVADEIANSCLLQVNLEARLKQVLLKEQELRLRQRIEAKMAARLHGKEADALREQKTKSS